MDNVLAGFTPRVRNVLELAKDESKKLKSPYVGSEHLVLGLLKLDEGVGLQLLQELGIRYESALKICEKYSAEREASIKTTDLKKKEDTTDE